MLLNKADTIDTQQLMRVYGALMWSLGKVMQTPEVCRVYIGSFWEAPLSNFDNRFLLEVCMRGFGDCALERTLIVRSEYVTVSRIGRFVWFGALCLHYIFLRVRRGHAVSFSKLSWSTNWYMTGTTDHN